METWKDIAGYEGLYKVSSYGRIKSFRKDKVNGDIMKQIESHKGYYEVSFRVKGQRKKFKVHRLVAIAFIPNKYNKPLINHKDGNKKNNNIDNLEWVTHSENVKHAYDNGFKSKLYGELNPNVKMKGEKHWRYGKSRSEETKNKISKSLTGRKFTEEHILKLKEKGIEKTKNRMHKIICLNTMEVFNCEREAHEKYKISRSSINRCCNGYLKSAGKINGEKACWMKYDEYIKLNTLK